MIFGQAVHYLVPMFQRPYVWDERDQWAPMWEDLASVLERQLDDSPSNDAVPHFMGAVVLDQVLVPGDFIQSRYVIDGQQRLTTLQLFLAAARDLALAEGLTVEAAQLETLVLNQPHLLREPEDRFKVVPSVFDREAFRSIVGGTTSPNPEHANHRMTRGYKYFTECLRGWAIEGRATEDVRRRFGVIANVLWKLIAVVAIDLEPGDNAQVIFETLNARGTPLLASDLIKNHLFRVALEQGHDADDLYVRHWEALDSEWWRAQVQAGRLKRPRLDIFMNHWLAMTRGEEVVSHLLFPEFKRYLAERPDQVVDVLANLSTYAEVWKSFEEADGEMGEFLYRVNTIEVSTAYPALLWMSGPSGIADPQQRLRAMRAIESWLIRRVIVRGNTQGYTQIFLALLKRLRELPAPSAADVVEYLVSLEGARGYWPADSAVTEALRTQPLYTLLIRSRMRLLLEAIEDDMHTDFNEQPAPRGLTVEHVLPQKWQQHWPLPAGIDPDEASLRRETLKHTIGNLTLVTRNLNPAMSNSAWAEKKGYMETYSLLNLASDIRRAETWDEGQIEGRTKWMIERILRIWPDSSSPEWHG